MLAEDPPHLHRKNSEMPMLMTKMRMYFQHLTPIPWKSNGKREMCPKLMQLAPRKYEGKGIDDATTNR